MRRFDRWQLAAAAVTSFLFVAQAGMANGRDLVVIEAEARGLLIELGIPTTWKGATFLVGEWDDELQDLARRSNVPFEIVAAGFDESREIYLVEAWEGSPPPQWPDQALYRDGRKWILELDAGQAADWTRRGFPAVRIPRESVGWRSAAPLVAYDCSYDPLVAGILDQTSQTKWLDWIEKLSGEETVTLDGQEQTILTRHSTPMFSGAAHARGYDFALQQIQSWGYEPNQIEEDTYAGTGGETWKNLVVTLPGLQFAPAEIVLLTAHLDSTSASPGTLAPGADDDGTGSATLFEALRLLRQQRFHRTIRVILFTGEEDGLRGSGAYVSDHDTTHYLGVVNVDMIGFDGDGDRCFELHAGTIPASNEVAQCFRDSTAEYDLMLSHDFLTTGATDRSDHASFWQADVGAVAIIENFFSDGLPDGCNGQDRNPDYHTTDDTVDHLAVPFGFSVAQAALATIAAMAIPVEACFDGAPELAAVPGESAVALEWTPLEGAATYRVYRSTQGCAGQWLPVGETAGTEWIDEGAGQPLPYDYRVEAVDEDGFCVSATSNCATATPIVHHATASDAVWLDVCAAGGPGDGNGIVEPGENVLVPISLRNDGNASLTGVGGVLASFALGIEIDDPYGEWPDLAPQDAAQSEPNHFGVQVSPSVSCGVAVTLGLGLTYAEGMNGTDVPLQVGSTNSIHLIDEDFSGGLPPDWTVVDGGSGGGGSAATWTTANPGGRSIGPPVQAPFAIVDSDHAGSGASQDEQLITPVLDASGCVELDLQFANQFRWYSGSGDELADVDVSVDGGGVWTNVLRIRQGSDGYTEPNMKTVDLAPFVAADPGAVQVRFHYHQAQYEYWWAVDNVRLTCAIPVCSPCAGPLGSPGEPGTTIPLTLDRDSGDLVFDWGASAPACETADYEIYRGDLTTLRSTGYDHGTVLTCGTSGSTTFAIAETDPRIGTADYYLVVAENGVQEGSYGRNSAGLERRPSPEACRPAQNMSSCAP